MTDRGEGALAGCREMGQGPFRLTCSEPMASEAVAVVDDLTLVEVLGGPGNERVQVEATDLRARAIQHEIDHLDGKLFIDRISFLKRSRYIQKRKKQLREEGES